ncbi:glycerophosphodiester phosphodiesterase family protein [Labrys monachus]|uniref:Glycerophosphoryl diester phosphodiesterase n=1 Tax=Labrys monachus TaxID=217067 RepID=A0ABU0FHG1_9HYPH|nr:glycerophosphodiester phosphodiesterase family protein [Labrys monachus]MDQ0394043.1 glycerophosphoryl diester phosphodiesterase [Labrys monachus]
MRADWIADRPIAHRGFHDAARGVLENTASAFSAAVAGGFAMECDVQITADGEAMVFHDDTLDRLMEGSGRLDSFTRAELQTLPMRQGRDRMITLGELCDLVAGRAPVIVEIKAAWSADRRLEARVAQILGGYKGPVAVMSFDPGSMRAMRALAPSLPRGVTQESVYDDPEWDRLTAWQKFSLGRLLHLPQSRPDFLAWYVKDLHYRAPRFARAVLGLPMLTWTVRTAADQARAALYADQMIFEGFTP